MKGTMTPASFVQGDTLGSVLGALADDAGVPIDLEASNSGGTVRFQMRSVFDRRFAVDGEASIVDASVGEVRYDWAAGDLAASGNYLARWEVVASDSGTFEHTDPGVGITVDPA